MWQIVVKFGLLAVALMILLQLSKYSLLTYGLHSEVLVAVFAAFFLTLGVIVARMIFKRKSAEDIEPQQVDHSKIDALSISKREYEVLKQMAAGKSNLEIAEELFIAESTVKTHVSNLLVKLDAKRRTQAINTAKSLGII